MAARWTRVTAPPAQPAVLPRSAGVLTGVGVTGFVTVALLIGLASWPASMDRWLTLTVLSHRSTALTALAQAMTWLGSGPVVVVVAFLVAATLWARCRRLPLPAALLGAVATSAALETMIKILVGRPRPPAAWVLGVPETSKAFPSGHTTNGTVIYVLAAVLLAATINSATVRRTLIGTGIVAAAAIGWSRVYLGYHWFTDVAAGWFLAVGLVGGTLSLLAVWTALDARGPVPAPVQLDSSDPFGHRTDGVVDAAPRRATQTD